MMDYAGRHVVVTGGTGALGSAVVGALLQAGAHCHVPFRKPEIPPHFAHARHRNVTLHPRTDLADDAQATLFYAALPALWASIHLAGGFAMSKIGDTSKADLMRQIDMNLASAFLCSREAVKAMARGKAGGRIVNVAARPALEPRAGAGMTAYAVSKAGVAALTAALAEEVATQDILVNAVAPSVMDTPANRAAMPKADHTTWPKVEDVAATILFLASPQNTATRGAVIPVYGKS
jgi:NAD(P)-dependent dehydrogenase (short-subunit alcohol dehydrogenase family)